MQQKERKMKESKKIFLKTWTEKEEKNYGIWG